MSVFLNLLGIERCRDISGTLKIKLTIFKDQPIHRKHQQLQKLIVSTYCDRIARRGL